MEKMMKSDFMDRWVSVLEISHYLGISKETVYRWLELKKIPAHKIGRQWKFQISEVDDWVRTGKSAVLSFDHELPNG